MSATRNRSVLLTMLASGVLSLALAAPASAQAQTQTPTKPQATAEQPAKEVKLQKLEENGKLADREELVGKQAVEFTLKDTEGKEHTLSDYLNDGKVVVIEWFNPTCPYVIKHHERHSTMSDLAAKYEEKGVVWLAVNSGSGDTAENNEKYRTKWSIDYPVLLDSKGAVGMAYGSKNTPTMYVIDKEGTLRYVGAIDNNSDNSTLGDTNYVDKALEAVLAGSNVETAYAEPYGCSIKYPRN